MIMPTRSLLLASLLADADAARKAAPRKSVLDDAANKAARGAEYIDPFIVMGTEKELQKRLDWMAAANQVAVVDQDGAGGEGRRHGVVLQDEGGALVENVRSTIQASSRPYHG